MIQLILIFEHYSKPFFFDMLDQILYFYLIFQEYFEVDIYLVQ